MPDEVIGAIGNNCLIHLNGYLEPERCYEDEGARILLQNYNVIAPEGGVHVPALYAHPVQTESRGPREVEMRSHVGQFDAELRGDGTFAARSMSRFAEMEGRGISTRSGSNRTFVLTMPTVAEDEEDAFEKATCSEIDADEVEIDPKNRNAKATKADDAPIPEYLWNDDAMKAGNLPRNRGTQRAFKVLRRGMLRFWKRRLAVEYGGWLRSHRKKWEAAPNVEGIGTQAYAHLRLNQPMEYTGHQVYGWAADGRLSYQKWWKWRESTQKRSLGVGRDAVERAGNTSWWE